MAKKSGGRWPNNTNEGDNKKGEPQQQMVDPGDQPVDVTEELEDEPLPQDPDPKDPKNSSGSKPKPKGAGNKPKGPKQKPKGSKPNDPVPPVPKNTMDTISEEPITWYKTSVAYDTKRTGLVATPPEGLLNVTRKRKVRGQPKPSTSGGSTVNKRKRTTPAKWMPYTQPRTTYTIGNKITPVWGLTHRGDMDPAENLSVPLYTPPKLTEKQEAAQKEAHKKKKKYRRYKPGQLALKEIKYYEKKPSFIISISAIRRLCLEIGYEFKQNISFQMHAYRLLQEAAEWYLVRVFKDINLLALHARRVTISPRDMILARKVSRDYGQHSTWAWNSDHLERPWDFQGVLTQEQKLIKRHYLESERGYKRQTWKVKARK